jgi:hypothetical protein
VTEGRQSFSVDIAGLLQALTEQFPEPLLCVRELVQNAADAGAQRIEVDVAYDASRSLFRLSVRDDGRGMNEAEVEGYLTIGFSEKDPGRDRGRFGVGKLSPYALGIVRMVVETCDGHTTHRLTFNRDGSGTIARSSTRGPRGTVVRVYKQLRPRGGRAARGAHLPAGARSAAARSADPAVRQRPLGQPRHGRCPRSTPAPSSSPAGRACSAWPPSRSTC